jgi:hypothetical protein
MNGVYRIGPLHIFWHDHGIFVAWRQMVKWECRWRCKSTRCCLYHQAKDRKSC